MNIYGHIIDLKKLTLNLVRLVLCLFVLSSSLHLDEHHHSAEDGYSICKVNCKSCEPHARYENCEECIIKRSKETFVTNITHFNFSNNKSLLFSLGNQFFKKYSIDFYCYSRPPPPLNIV